MNVTLGLGAGRVNKECKHPPERLYAWYVDDVLCIGCCECGKVLKGGVSLENTEDLENA